MNELPWPVSVIAFSELQFDIEESGGHALNVTVYDPDSKVLARSGYSISVGKENLLNQSPTILAFSVGKNGKHKFVLEVDSRIVADRTVAVDTSNSHGQRAVVGFGQS